MLIRQIKEKDNLEVEKLIRDCLIEFGGNRPGCAWEDKDLGRFYQVYQPDNRQYLVVIKDGHVVGGCGIGPVVGKQGICELQKMYCYKEIRGTGIAKELLDQSLVFAKKHYQKCYLETFSQMVAANRFYLKNGFQPLDKPLIQGPHYACDRWYIKDL
ncbi:GNAT family N-acetyltransferase [Allocoprobacillus halotolerans]|uniref:GNAT family N-acetyltransferase n=1 Tax=Allocoprobacillus halotolerans TaxID=2944914 RepID=A0ABY5I4D7_9FIRM|nr:GNAT family N-acetyltransferase [Allocoprobacillus halotolerans]UTY40211.1 GNAT family N-acetyltransferase [Allocoprobacillus halotolerans]